jgi:thioredoxin-dependent peroxiredoxin
MKRLAAGDKAPRFSLLDQRGKKVSSSDFAGRRLLVYFYPAADTPGCTEQACSVRDARRDLSRKKLAVIGISPDAPDEQKAFDAKFSLGFPLLSDPAHKVAEAYGVWGEKVMFGRKFFGIIRSAFLIGEDGKIVEAWYRVPAGRTVEKALEALA